MENPLRLFIGIEFSPALQDALSLVQRELHSAGFRGRFAAIANLHLTLKFLGEVPSSALPAIRQSLSPAGLLLPAFTLTVEKLGLFGRENPYRVLWAGIGGDLAPLQQLQRRVDQSMAVLGYSLEKRPYHPHITLARDIDIPDPSALAGVSLAKCPPISVKRFALIASTVEQGRRQYRALSTFDLCSAQAGRTAMPDA